MPIRAPASRESRRRSQCTCEPRPDRHAVGQHLDHAAEGVAVLVRLVDLGDHRLARRRRRGSAPGRRRAAPRRRAPAARRAGPWPPPSSTTWETISIPVVSLRYDRATAPSATRAAVSRALARSRIGRASSKPYFCMPARSAWPGRGRVSGALRASSASISGSTGSAAITCSHLGHSVLPTITATGLPMRESVPDAAEEGDLVVLELHPRAAAVAEPAPGQRVGHQVGGDRHPGGQALQGRDECGAVRLPRRQPAQPAQRCSLLPHCRVLFPILPRGTGRPWRTSGDRDGPAGSARGERGLLRPPASPPAVPATARSSARPGAPPGGPAGRGRRRPCRRPPTRRPPAASATGRTARRRARPGPPGRPAASSSVAPAGVVAITSGAPNASAADDHGAVRTCTPSRSPHSRISSARAAPRT